MFWGNGRGVNSMEYTHVLKHGIFPEMRSIFEEAGKGKFYFQQDGAPIHTSQATQHLFRVEEVETFPWPPNSPDLNLIENLWKDVQSNVQKKKIKSFEHFQEVLREQWKSVSLQSIRDMYDGMGKRLDLVINGGGKFTQY